MELREIAEAATGTAEADSCRYSLASTYYDDATHTVHM